MALYQNAGFILLAPLLAFAVIIFGTRPWDLLSRPRVQTTSGASPLATTGDGHDAHGDVAVHDHDEPVEQAHRLYVSQKQAKCSIFFL